MKKVAILLALFCMLTVTASAAYIPEDVISENRDGRQLIVKTYMLPPDCLLYTSPSPRDGLLSRMPSSA